MNSSPLDRVSLKIQFIYLHWVLVQDSFVLHQVHGEVLAGTILGSALLACLGLKIFLILTALCFALGCYLCQKTADDMGVHDHGSIVWDEFVGVFIVLAAIPTLSLPWIVIAFVLFRFFDILKPYPIRYFDQKLESGFGIMVDDVLAAVYAVIVIVILRIVGLPC